MAELNVFQSCRRRKQSCTHLELVISDILKAKCHRMSLFHPSFSEEIISPTAWLGLCSCFPSLSERERCWHVTRLSLSFVWLVFVLISPAHLPSASELGRFRVHVSFPLFPSEQESKVCAVCSKLPRMKELLLHPAHAFGSTPNHFSQNWLH